MSASEFGVDFPRGEEERLRLAGPAKRCEKIVVDIDDTAVFVTPLLHRKSVNIQNIGAAPLWVNFGGVAVAGECLYLATGNIFSMDIKTEVSVSLLSTAAATKVIVIQTGP